MRMNLRRDIKPQPYQIESPEISKLTTDYTD